jgi:hypothetical protein
MNNENIQYDKLPIIDIKNDKFMDLNQDLSINLISSFIGKQVIYRKYENNELLEDIGTLVGIKYGKLIIDHYDTEITEFIPITDIRDLEALETKTISKEYIGKICEITNIHCDKNIVYINNIDDLEIEFNYKILENDKEEILTSYYPIGLVENIVIIDSIN